VGENSGPARAVNEMVSSRSLDMGKLIRMSYETFYSGTDDQRKNNYALAWAMIYYLRKGAILETPNPYAKVLNNYCDALWETGDAGKATDAAFNGIDIEAFQRSFVLFWTSQKKRGAAIRNNIFKAYNPGARK